MTYTLKLTPNYISSTTSQKNIIFEFTLNQLGFILYKLHSGDIQSVVKELIARGLIPVFSLGVPLRCKASKLGYPLRIPPLVKETNTCLTVVILVGPLSQDRYKNPLVIVNINLTLVGLNWQNLYYTPQLYDFIYVMDL